MNQAQSKRSILGKELEQELDEIIRAYSVDEEELNEMIREGETIAEELAKELVKWKRELEGDGHK